MAGTFRNVVVSAIAAAAVATASPILAVEKISVKGLFNNKAIVVIDGKQRLLRAGETSPEGVKLISANSKEAVL